MSHAPGDAHRTQVLKTWQDSTTPLDWQLLQDDAGHTYMSVSFERGDAAKLTPMYVYAGPLHQRPRCLVLL